MGFDLDPAGVEDSGAEVRVGEKEADTCGEKEVAHVPAGGDSKKDDWAIPVSFTWWRNRGDER